MTRPRLLLAVLGGFAVFGAFPPLGWWPLAAAGTALCVLAWRGATPRHAALLGAVTGLAFFVPLLSWLRVIGVDAWLLLAGVEAAFFAGLGAAVAVATRLRGWPVWVAALWVLQEALRDRVPFGGFPWGRLAFSQGDGPLVRVAALAGAPLVTFGVALTGCLAAAAVVSRHLPRRAGILALGAVPVPLVALAVRLPVAGESGPRGPAYADVAVVQGNVPRLGLREFEQERAVIRHHADATKRLAASVDAGERPRPQAVIWPENSSDFDPFVDAEARALIDDAVRTVGAPTLVGAVLDGVRPGTVRNSGIVWDPHTGPGAIYVKRHPVPFGEYVPFRSVLSRFIGRFALVPSDFAAGRTPGVLQVGPVRVGDVICFEVAYDGVVRDAVTAGGRVLTVQTNNATYEHPGDSGRSGETAQQLAISQVRAVEHGRAVLVAATSGVSAVIGPNGRVSQRTSVFTAEVLSARVPLRDTMTLADRVRSVPEWGLAALGGAAVVVGLRRRRGAGRQLTAGGPPAPAEPVTVRSTS